MKKPIQQAVVDGVLWTFDVRRWWIYAKKRTRQGFTRSMGSLVPVTQAAIGSTIAYLIAERILNHQAPVFAAITAWLCLGFTRNRQPRKVAEMGFGVALGVLFGEVFGHYFGIGAWQILLMLLAAPLVARFLDRGELFTIQAAINSLTILMMAALGTGGIEARWGDAVVGAVIAFIFAVFLPRNVTSRPRRYVRAVLREFSEALDGTARGLRAGDVEVLFDVQAAMRNAGQTLSDGQRAVGTAAEVTRLNRSLTKDREIVAELQRLFTLLDRVETAILMIIRQGGGAIMETGPVPKAAELLVLAQESLDLLTKAIADWREPIEAREKATELARRCAPAELADWRASVLVSLIRSLVVDLLQMTGLTRPAARALLLDTGDVEEFEEDPDLDERDTLWAPRDGDRDVQ